MSQEELDALNQTNSYLVNSQLMNNWFQRDIQFANRRAFDLEKLHNHLFDLETQANMDEKTLVALYNIGINDMNKRAQMMLKIAETSEKSRLIREINKRMADQAKKASIEGTEQSHTIKTLQLLLDESMRHTLEDECQKKYGSSNSYRPPEDESYEVLAIDINADE